MLISLLYEVSYSYYLVLLFIFRESKDNTKKQKQTERKNQAKIPNAFHSISAINPNYGVAQLIRRSRRQADESLQWEKDRRATEAPAVACFPRIHRIFPIDIYSRNRHTSSQTRGLGPHSHRRFFRGASCAYFWRSQSAARATLELPCRRCGVRIYRCLLPKSFRCIRRRYCRKLVSSRCFRGLAQHRCHDATESTAPSWRSICAHRSPGQRACERSRIHIHSFPCRFGNAHPAGCWLLD